MKINYETKCRRCGRIVMWAGPEFEERFMPMFVVEKSNHPMVQECDTCGMNTVQDVVSFKTIKS